MMTQCKVIIIGAGASGIAAATRLAQKGISDFIVLEAENRIGGRIHSTTFDNKTLDLGAQWVHGEKNNVVYDLAQPRNLLESPNLDMFNGQFVTPSGTILNQELAQNTISALYRISKQLDGLTKSTGTLGDFFLKEYKKLTKTDKSLATPEAKLIYSWYEHFENSLEGSDSWYETSAPGLAQYWECDGELLTTWRSGLGYQKIFDVMMESTPDPKLIEKRLLLNKEVNRIIWRESETSDISAKSTNQERIIVTCNDGSLYESEHVIVTLPLGVLKEQVFSMFYPVLPPSKLIAIKGLAIGTVDKIFLRFSKPWWPSSDCHGFSFVWTEAEKSNFIPPSESPQPIPGRHWLTEVFGFYLVDNCPNILCGWVTGAAARQMELASPSQVLEGCYYLLNRFLGKQYKISKPDEVLRSTWGLNPHFKGSYSFRSIYSDILATSSTQLAEPICDYQGKPLVLFAGEATHQHYYSTVHGAIETGWREADRLLPWLRKSYSPKEYDIIIIGAGISGLAAAKTLCDFGFKDVLILEAQKEPGGRIRSELLTDGWVESGAQWLHGEENDLSRLAKKFDLLADYTSSEGEGPYLCPDGSSVDLSLVHEVAGVIGQILEDCEDFASNDETPPSSLGDYLRVRFEKYLSTSNDSDSIKRRKRQLYNWHIRFQIIDNSCTNLEELSAKAWGNYSFCGGKDYLNFKKGYFSLIDSLIKLLPENSLILNSPVIKIRYPTKIKLKEHNSSLRPIEVITAQGSYYKAKHVIITSSIGFLKENHSKIFEPNLPPAHIKIIKDLGFCTINKIFLEFERPWWSSDLKGIQLLWDEHSEESNSWTYYLTGFDVLPNHRAVLMGWVGGPGACHVEGLTESEIGGDCVTILRNFLKKPDIPEPRAVIRSRWSSNPYVLGSYSHTTIACDKSKSLPENLAEPVFAEIESFSRATENQYPLIWFAGEALHPKYFSTTHGAFEVGQMQAEKLTKFMSSFTMKNLSLSS